MPVGLSSAEVAELSSYAPRVRIEAYIIKDPYGSPTEIDITDRVVRFGRFANSITLLDIDWELPHMTMVVTNHDDWFNQNNADSIWSTSPVADPLECELRVREYVITPGSETLFIEYLGRIRNSPISSITDLQTVELVTCFAPCHWLDVEATKKHGSWTEFAWNAGPPASTSTLHHKGGFVIPAPTGTTEPVLRGGAPYGYTHTYQDIEDMSNLMHCEFVHDGTVDPPWPLDRRELTNSWMESNQLYHTGAKEFRFENDSPSRIWHTGGDFIWWNPLQWHDVTPNYITRDLLTLGAALDATLINQTSFNSQASYFTSKTPTRTMRAVAFGKTYAEHLIEMLSYAPEAFVAWRLDGGSYKLNFHLLDDISTPATPFSFGDTPKNYAAIEEVRQYDERFGTTVRAHYNAYVDNGWSSNFTWQSDRSWNLGRKAHTVAAGTSAPPASVYDFIREELTARTPLVKEKTIDLERPWLTSSLSDHWERAGDFIDDYHEMFDRVLTRVTLRAPLHAADVELGDVVQLDIARISFAGKRFVVAGKDFEFDDQEFIFTLVDFDYTL